MDNYSLEIIMKGASSHHRIAVLKQLKSQPDMSVEELSHSCGIAYKTLSVHLQRMESAGLISKTHFGRRVEHKLTPLGEKMAEFLRTLS